MQSNDNADKDIIMYYEVCTRRLSVDKVHVGQLLLFTGKVAWEMVALKNKFKV